ncbi:MAG: hypothetical protein WCD76_17750 [Pyrinomonadaceae bacterium]
MPEQNEQPEKSRVRELHIGRVYNLGNYENMRVEVTVSVGTGDDPARLLRSVENILRDLRAKSGVDSWGLSRARAALERLGAIDDAALTADDRQELDVARDKLRRVEEANARRAAARAALSTLDYTEEHRDAKDDWDDDY